MYTHAPHVNKNPARVFSKLSHRIANSCHSCFWICGPVDQPITLIRFWSLPESHLKTVTMDTTITLAAIPADPALQNLQFSPDGQVLLATRSALYILVRETKRSLVASHTEQTLFRRPQTSV
jgi:hypothetical protein